MSDALFAAMSQTILDGDSDLAVTLARQAIEQGITPIDAINRGFVPGMKVIGDRFSRGEAFLPELVLAGNTMKAAIAVLEMEMLHQGTERDTLGTVILATVEGDIHDIGKTLVGIMLTVNGFNVIDLGPNVRTVDLMEKVREVKPDIVGLSALLTTTMVRQRDVIEALEDMGLRGNVRVIIGGAPITEQWSNEIGADGFSKDAAGAVELALSLVGQK